MVIFIYADIVFAVNFIMNCVSLYFAFIICKEKISYRLFISSFLSSLLYTILIFFPYLYNFLGIFASVIFILPSGLIAFENKPFNIIRFIKNTLAIFICTFALGGVAMAISTANSNYEWITTAHFAARHFTFFNIFIAISISFALLKFGQIYIFKNTISKQEYCNITIYIENNKKTIKALIDTGNNLECPISKSPVIIIEKKQIKDILPYNFENRIRLIPFKSIGNNSGILKGIRADKVEIIDRNIEKRDIIIAICDFSLSNSGEYFALMNPNLI